WHTDCSQVNPARDDADRSLPGAIGRPEGDPTSHGVSGMAKASALSSWQRAVIVMAWTVVAGVGIAALYLAQEIFVPLALAIFLTFLLSPLVTALQRRGLRRGPSVLAIVVLAAALLFGVGWVMTQQVSALVESLPKYSKNIKEKFRSLREMFQ